MANRIKELTIGKEMKNNNTSPKNKVALVTESTTGIGYETAVHLAKNGFHTYTTVRNLPKAKEIQEIAEADRLPLDVIRCVCCEGR